MDDKVEENEGRGLEKDDGGAQRSSRFTGGDDAIHDEVLDEGQEEEEQMLLQLGGPHDDSSLPQAAAKTEMPSSTATAITPTVLPAAPAKEVATLPQGKEADYEERSMLIAKDMVREAFLERRRPAATCWSPSGHQPPQLPARRAHQRKYPAAFVVGNPNNSRLYHLIHHERRLGQTLALQTAVSRIKSLCNLWSSQEDYQRLIQQAISEMQVPLVGCQIMVGLLEPQGDSIKYVAVSPAGSNDALGRVLMRGDGVSFLAIDRGEHVCIMDNSQSPLNTPLRGLPCQLFSDGHEAATSPDQGQGLERPLLVVPMEAGGGRVGVVTISHFSLYDEVKGWEGTPARNQEVATRKARFASLKGDREYRKFKLWRHPHARTEGATQDEAAFSSFCGAGMVCGKVVDVRYHPRWGPSYTVDWEDGLRESNINARAMDQILNNGPERFGRGAFVDAGLIEQSKGMANAMGQAVDVMRKRACLRDLRGLTSRVFPTTVEEVYKAGLDAVVSHVLMNRMAEIWEVRQLSDIAYEVDAIARIDSTGAFIQGKARCNLDELPKTAKRLFFDRVFKAYHDHEPRAFTMPTAPEVVVAPFRDDAYWKRVYRPRAIKVVIIEAQHLAVAKKGMFGVGRTDPCCIVRYQGREIKRTCAKPNTCSPKWEAHEASFGLSLPEEPWETELIVEVWDQIKSKESLFLGRVVLRMEDLLFPSRGAKEYDLQTRPDHEAADAAVVQGKLCLAVRAQDKAKRHAARLTPDTNMVAAAAATATSIDDGTTSNQSLTTASSLFSKGLVSLVRVHDVQGLAWSATEKLTVTGVMVMVKWNGHEVGRTSVSSSPSHPLWDNAVVPVKLEGDPLTSRLMLEVWALGAMGATWCLARAVMKGDQLQVSHNDPVELVLEHVKSETTALVVPAARKGAKNTVPAGKIAISYEVQMLEGGSGGDDSSTDSLEGATQLAQPVPGSQAWESKATSLQEVSAPAAIPVPVIEAESGPTSSPSGEGQTAQPVETRHSPQSCQHEKKLVVRVHRAGGLTRGSLLGTPSSALVLIKWQGQEVGRTLVVEGTSDPVWQKEVFTIPFASSGGQVVGVLSFHVLEVDSKTGLTTVLGEVELGPDARGILGDRHAEPRELTLTKRSSLASAFSTSKPSHLCVTVALEEGGGVQGQGGRKAEGQAAAQTAPIVPKSGTGRRVRVVVHKASGLGRVDFFNKPEPYCIVKCNGMEIGRTETQHKTLEPVFDDESKPAAFVYDLPQPWEQAEICVELWSMTKTPPGTFLGQVTMLAMGLAKPLSHASCILEDAYTKRPTKGNLFLSCQLEEVPVEEQPLAPLGEHSTSVMPQEEHHYQQPSPPSVSVAAEIEPPPRPPDEPVPQDPTQTDPEPEAISYPEPGFETSDTPLEEDSLDMPNQETKNRFSLFRGRASKVEEKSTGTSLPVGTVKFKVLEANGLANTDMMGDMQLFCVIKWNQVEVARTQAVTKTLKPEWYDAHFDLELQGDAAKSDLSAELWGIKSGKEDAFLGQAVICGEDLMAASNTEMHYNLTSKPGMDKKAQKLVQGQLTVCWYYEPAPGEAAESDEEGEEDHLGAAQFKASASMKIDMDHFASSKRLVMHALVATRAPSYTWPSDAQFCQQLGPEVARLLRCVRGRDYRIKERRHCLGQLKEVCDRWKFIPFKRLLVSVRYILERCLPGCDGYVGLLQRGAKVMSYIEATRNSRMIGQRLKRGQGVSFDAVFGLKPVIFQERDVQVPPTPARYQPGDRCMIRYGRQYFPGKIVRWAGFESYDVIYDLGNEREVGVKAERIEWVPPTRVGPHKFPTSGKQGWPFICVPLRHGSTGIGVIALDRFETVPKGRPDEDAPEADVMEFLVTMGQYVGMAIDLQRKTKSLSILTGLGKNPSSKATELMQCTLDIIQSNILTLQRLEVWEEYTSDPSSLKLVQAVGTKVLFDRKLRKAVATEAAEILPSCGRTEEDDTVHCICYGPVPSVLIGRFRAWEVNQGDGVSEEESVAKRTWMVLFREPGITWQEDADYTSEVCEVVEHGLASVHSREFRGLARSRLVEKLVKLCQEWDEFDTGPLMVKVVDGLARCFPGSDVYLALLLPGGEMLEFRQATRRSLMAGKILMRGTGVSFDVVDNRTQLSVKNINDPNSLRVRVYGESLSKCLPMVSTPLRRGKRTIRGVVNVDSVGKYDEDDHPEPGELDFLQRISDALGTTLDIKSKEKSMADFVQEANAVDVTEAQLFSLAVKHLKLNIPLARSIERWYLPLEAVAQADLGDAGSIDGRPRRITLDIHQAKGLAKADLFGKSDPFCIVKWNHKEVGRTPVIHRTLDPVWKNAHFSFITGPNPLAASLCIEVWDMDQLGIGDFLGQVVIRGTDLVTGCGAQTRYSLKPKSGQDAKTKALVQGFLYISLEMDEVSKDADKLPASPAPEKRGSNSREEIESVKYLGPTLLLQIHKAEGLAKTDLLGKSDPYCLVKWRQKEVGKTKVIYKTLDPIWEEARFGVPLTEDDNTAIPGKVVVEVWDMDAIGPGSFLGEVILGSDDWAEPCSVAKAFHLKPKPTRNSGRMSMIQKDLAIRGQIYLRYRLKDPSNPDDTLEAEQACPLLKLDIMKCTGLAKADFFGKSDPFCVINWDGAKVGQTQVIMNTLDPVWEDEHFQIPLIGGHVETSTLTIDVYDWNRFTSGVFLGRVQFTGKELSAMSMKEVMDLTLKPRADSNEGGLEVKGHLTIRCQYIADPTKKHARPAYLRANFLKGRDIKKARISKAASLFGVMRYNGVVVAKTSPVDPVSDPVWADEPPLEVLSAGGDEMQANLVQLELWESTKADEEQCLASCSFNEEDYRCFNGKTSDVDMFPASQASGSAAMKTPVVTMTILFQIKELREDDPSLLVDLDLSRLRLKVHRAEGLAKANFFGNTDPFCIVKWADQEVGRTIVVPKSLNPVWKEASFDIEMGEAPLSTVVCVEVWDMSVMGTTHFLGQVTLSRRELQRTSGGEVVMDLKKKPRGDQEPKSQKLVQGKLVISYVKAKGAEAELAETTQFVGLDIHEARGLAKADLFGKSDPFCIIKWNDQEVGRTKVVPKTLDPVWEDEHFDVGLTGDPLSGHLTVEVWDMDGGLVGDFLGQVVVPGKELQTPTDGAVSIDLAPKEGEGSRIAVRGYLTLSYSTRDRLGKVIDASSSDPEIQREKFHQLVLNVRILEAVDLFPEGLLHQSSYCIIKWNGREAFRSKVVASSGSPKFDTEVVTLRVPKDRAKCWLQVDLMKQGLRGDEMIATLSLRGDLVIHTWVGPKRYRLTRVDDDTCQFPLLESYLVMVMLADARVWTECSQILTQTPSLVLQIHHGRGLGKADMFGNSDPFCVVKWGGKEVGKTHVIKNTINPEWEEEIFELPLPEDPTSTDLSIECWDMDALGVGDFLGCITVSCSVLIRLPPDRIEYELKEKQEEKATSQSEATDEKKKRKKKKADLVQGFIGISIRPKEMVRAANLRYELHPMRKMAQGNKVITSEVPLLSMDVYTLFQASSALAPSSCILYEDKEMVVSSITDMRIKVGETEVGAAERCYRYCLVACGPPGFSTYEDALFSRQLMTEFQSSLRRLRGIQQRVAVRAKSLQEIKAICANFATFHDMPSFYRALINCFEGPLLGCDVYMALVVNGGQTLRYVYCSSRSGMAGKELERGHGISFNCVGGGYHTFVVVQSPEGLKHAWEDKTKKKRRKHKKTLLEQVRVLGNRPRAVLPVIICPMLHGRCTVGVLGCDNFDQVGKALDTDNHPEPGVLNYLRSAAELIGSGLNMKRRHDAMVGFTEVLKSPLALPEDIFAMCMKVALLNISFATKAQIWRLDDDWHLHILASLSHHHETFDGVRILRVYNASLELYGGHRLEGADYFVKFTCGGLERRSSLKRQDAPPEWQEQYDFKIGPTVHYMWAELWSVDQEVGTRKVAAKCKFDLVDVGDEGRKQLYSYWYGEEERKFIGKLHIEALIQVVEELPSDTIKASTSQATALNMHSLRLTIIKANGLAKADLIGSSDPFVIVKWKGKELGQTAVVKNNLNPVWSDEIFNMNLQEDALETQLVLEVWDKDGALVGDFLGQLLLTAEALLNFGKEAVTLDLQDHPDGKGKNVQGSLTFSVEVREGSFVEGRVGHVDKNLRAKMTELVTTVRQTMGWYDDKDVTQGTLENSVLRVEIFDARNLARKSAVAIIRVDKVERGRTDVVKGTPSPKFVNQVFYFLIPDKTRPEAEVCIELWNVSNLNQPLVFLGQLVFKGTQLMRIPKGAVEYDLEKKLGCGVEYTKHVKGALCVSMAWRQLQPSSSLENLLVVDHLISNPPPTTVAKQKLLKLVVHSAKDLPRADTFGTSDPYFIIKWQGHEVGRTQVVWNCLDPIYEDEIFLLKVEDVDDPDVTLTLEAWDKDMMGPGDLLGEVKLQGMDLLKDMKEQALELSRGGRQQGKVMVSLGEFDDRYVKEVLEVRVKEAHGLAKADFLGKSDPFVVVKWNGKEAGRTKVKYSTLDPVWNETFFLHIPHDRRELCLRLEVWDMDIAGTGEFLGQVELGPDEILQPAGAVERFRLTKKKGQHKNLHLIQGYLEVKRAHRSLKMVEALPEKVEVPRRKMPQNVAMDIVVADDPLAEELRRKKEGLELPGLQARTLALAELCDSVIGNPAYQPTLEVGVNDKEAGEGEDVDKGDNSPAKRDQHMEEEEDDDDDDVDEDDDTSMTDDETALLGDVVEPDTSIIAEVPSGQVVTAMVKGIASTILRGIVYDRLVVTFADEGAKAANRPTPGYALVVYCRAKEVYPEDRAFGRLLAERVTEELAIVRRRQARSEVRQQVLFRVGDMVAPSKTKGFTGSDVELCRSVLPLIAPCLSETCVTRIHLLSFGGKMLTSVASTRKNENQSSKRIERGPSSELLFRCLEQGRVVFLTRGKCRLGHAAWPSLSQAEMKVDNSLLPDPASQQQEDHDRILVPLWTRDYSLGVLEVSDIQGLHLEVLESAHEHAVGNGEVQLEEGMLDFLGGLALCLAGWINDYRQRTCLQGLTSLLNSQRREDHSATKVLTRAVAGLQQALPHVSSIHLWQLTVTVGYDKGADESDLEISATPPALPTPNGVKTRFMLTKELAAKVPIQPPITGEGSDKPQEGRLSQPEGETLAITGPLSYVEDEEALNWTMQSTISKLLSCYGGGGTINTMAQAAMQIYPFKSTVKSFTLKTSDPNLSTTRTGAIRWQPWSLPSPGDPDLLAREWYRMLKFHRAAYFWSSSDHLVLLLRVRKPKRTKLHPDGDKEEEGQEEEEEEGEGGDGNPDDKGKRGQKGKKKKVIKEEEEEEEEEEESHETVAIALKGGRETLDLAFLVRVAAMASKLLTKSAAETAPQV